MRIHSVPNVGGMSAWCQLLKPDLEGEPEMSSLEGPVEEKLREFPPWTAWSKGYQGCSLELTWSVFVVKVGFQE